MTDRTFIDTNILIYALDRDEPEKSARARSVLASDDERVISAQVLGEFYVTATRKLAPQLTLAEGRAAVDELSRLHVVPIDRTLVIAAIVTAASAQISYWDALIVEAAASAGCIRILTEDLTDGQTIRGVEIVNPFP